MRLVSRRRLTIAAGIAAAAVLAALLISIGLRTHPGIACPSVSRSKAGTAGGAFPPGKLLWIVVVVPASGQRFPGSKLRWVVKAIDATTGEDRLGTRDVAEAWPPFFNKLPDRAWLFFC
jgi:hypothetical protein